MASTETDAVRSPGPRRVVMVAAVLVLLAGAVLYVVRRDHAAPLGSGGHTVTIVAVDVGEASITVEVVDEVVDTVELDVAGDVEISILVAGDDGAVEQTTDLAGLRDHLLGVREPSPAAASRYWIVVRDGEVSLVEQQQVP